MCEYGSGFWRNTEVDCTICSRHWIVRYCPCFVTVPCPDCGMQAKLPKIKKRRQADGDDGN